MPTNWRASVTWAAVIVVPDAPTATVARGISNTSVSVWVRAGVPELGVPFTTARTIELAAGSSRSTILSIRASVSAGAIVRVSTAVDCTACPRRIAKPGATFTFMPVLSPVTRRAVESAEAATPDVCNSRNR